MQNIKTILPNLSVLDLDQQDIEKLNELFNNCANKKLNSSKKLNLQSECRQQTIKNPMNPSKQSAQNSTYRGMKGSPSQNLLSLLAPNPRTPHSLGVNPKIRQITNQTLSTISKHRQSQLLSQLQYLKQQLSLLHTHLETVNQKYQQKRDEANQFMMKYVEIRDQNEDLIAKLALLQSQFEKREKQIKFQFQTQYQNVCNDIQLRIQQYEQKIGKILQKNRQLQQTIIKYEADLQDLNNVLGNQRKVFKNQEKQLGTKITKFQEQNINLKDQIKNINSRLLIKSKQCIQKEQKLESLQKTVKQVSQRMAQVQRQTKRQLLKQRSITKKAIDGLQMTRKYSQMQLNKSRRKQKQFMQKQKELINMIKDICKQKQEHKQKQNQSSVNKNIQKSKSRYNIKSISMVDTADNEVSCKKTGIKSLNTTLKLTKNKVDTNNGSNYSPFVSNFNIDQSQSNINRFTDQDNQIKNSGQFVQNSSQQMYREDHNDKIRQYSPIQKVASTFNLATNKQKVNTKYLDRNVINNNFFKEQQEIDRNGPQSHREQLSLGFGKSIEVSRFKLDSHENKNLVKDKKLGVKKQTQTKNVSVKIKRSGIKNDTKQVGLKIDTNLQSSDPNYHSLNSTTSLGGSGTPCFEVHTSKSSNNRNFGIKGITRNQSNRVFKATPINQY